MDTTVCLTVLTLTALPGYHFIATPPETASYILNPTTENYKHYIADHPPAAAPGIWRKKTVWKPRFIKQWRSSKVWKPVWRKIWGPIEVHEWVPIPKPPPGSDIPSTELEHVEEHSTSPIWKLEHPDTVTWPYLKPVEVVKSEENEVEYGAPTVDDYDNGTRPVYEPEKEPHSGFYYVNSPDPEEPKRNKVKDDMSRLLTPPVASPVYRHVYFTTDTPLDENSTQSYQRQVSPYAVNLAQAIILDKLRNTSSTTRKPLSLTEVRYVSGTSTVVPAVTSNKLGKLTVGSTTERTQKEDVFVVTPTSTKSS